MRVGIPLAAHPSLIRLDEQRVLRRDGHVVVVVVVPPDPAPVPRTTMQLGFRELCVRTSYLT